MTERQQRRYRQLCQLLEDIRSEKRAWFALLSSPVPELSRVAKAAYSRARDMECLLCDEMEHYTRLQQTTPTQSAEELLEEAIPESGIVDCFGRYYKRGAV